MLRRLIPFALMKTEKNLLSAWTFAVCSCILSSPIILNAQQVGRIPEPGLIMYCVILNVWAGANYRLTTGTLRCTIPKPSGGTVTLTTALTNINDQFSYLLIVPFETLPAPPPVFTLSPNALQLT